MVREAYPINHFLLVAIYCLIVLRVGAGFTRRHIGLTSLACACFAIASLTLESGLVVATVAFAAYACGASWNLARRARRDRGAHRRLRDPARRAALHMIGNAVGERQTGFGTMMLSTADLRVALRRHAVGALRLHDPLVGAHRSVFATDRRPMDGGWRVESRGLSGSVLSQRHLHVARRDRACRLVHVDASAPTDSAAGGIRFRSHHLRCWPAAPRCRAPTPRARS